MIYTNTAIFQVAEAPAGSLLLDTYTGAEVATSIRKLRTAYGGSAMRVRRDSTSTTLDIGFDGSGNLDTDAIETFCAGTTGRVDIWYDQSGNALNMTSTTVTQMPIIYSAGAVKTLNGLPSLWFDRGGNYATSKQFTNTSYSNLTNQGEIFTVAAQTPITVSNPTNYGRIVTMRKSAANDDYNTADQFIGVWAANSPRVYCENNSINTPGNTYTAGTPYLINYGKNSNALFTSLNNNTPTTTLSAPTSNLAANRLQIGYDKPAGSDGAMAGYMSEMLTWNSEQSANRSGIKTNINDYFSLY